MFFTTGFTQFISTGGIVCLFTSKACEIYERAAFESSLSHLEAFESSLSHLKALFLTLKLLQGIRLRDNLVNKTAFSSK